MKMVKILRFNSKITQKNVVRKMLPGILVPELNGERSRELIATLLESSLEIDVTVTLLKVVINSEHPSPR
jgi:hypothetical protein